MSLLPPFFIFFNSRSGQRHLAPSFQKYHSQHTLPLSDNNLIVHLFELNNPATHALGFKTLADLMPSPVTVVSAGGDGTLTWILSSLVQLNIPTSSLSFAIMPLGTGNDLS